MFETCAHIPVRRRTAFRGLGSLTLLLFAVGLVPAAGAAPPTISFAKQSVEVTGLTPGAAAALVGVGHGFNGFAGYQAVWDDLLADGDADGAVQRELEFEPTFSVWAAVDSTSGEVSLAAPEGVELHEAPVPAGAFAEPGVVTDQRRSMHLLVVRPGGGAGSGTWAASFGDGGEGDADGEENLSIRAPLAALSAIVVGATSSTSPPESLAAGDVVVVIDLETREVYAARLVG